jgi:hypothetical protein
MQRGSKGNAASGPTSIADLRASLRAAQEQPEPKLAKPPKPRKAPKRESEEERAIKAEKLAMAQHTTSLLKGGKPAGKDYKRPGEREERKGTSGGLFLQLIFVAGVAGGVAYALDPTIVPAAWTDKAQEFISQYIKI